MSQRGPRGGRETEAKELIRVTVPQAPAQPGSALYLFWREHLQRGEFSKVIEASNTPSNRVPPDLLAWARFGQGFPARPGAQAEIALAESILKERDPSVLKRWAPNDHRRRVLELAWCLMEGRVEDAAYLLDQHPINENYLGSSWQGIVEIACGRPARAVLLLHPSVPVLAEALRSLKGETLVAPKAARYATALAKGERDLAAGLVIDGVSADMTSARIAAAGQLRHENRAGALQHLDALGDPFLKALWKVRLGLINPVAGWQEVARQATGHRAPARARALLLAAIAARTEGDESGAQRLLAAAGPEVERFPEELTLLRPEMNRWSLQIAEAIRLGTHDAMWQKLLIEALRSTDRPFDKALFIAQASKSDLLDRVWLSFTGLIALKLKTDPRARLWFEGPISLPPMVWTWLVSWLVSLNARPWHLHLARVVPTLKDQERFDLLVHSFYQIAFDDSYGDLELLAKTWCFQDPHLLASCLGGAVRFELERVHSWILQRPESEQRDQLEVACAEACDNLGFPFPEELLVRARKLKKSAWHAWLRARFLEPLPKEPELPPAARAALKVKGYVFLTDPDEVENRNETLNEFDQEVLEFIELARELELIPETRGAAPAADRDSKKAKRKAVKAARKKQRKRR